MAAAESPLQMTYRALRKYWHNSRRVELNEALICLGKVKWGFRSSPLRNAGTYATIDICVWENAAPFLGYGGKSSRSGHRSQRACRARQKSLATFTNWAW